MHANWRQILQPHARTCAPHRPSPPFVPMHRWLTPRMQGLQGHHTAADTFVHTCSLLACACLGPCFGQLSCSICMINGQIRITTQSEASASVPFIG